MKETDRQMKKTDREIRELGKQIGGLGNKFGGFTEGLALPSMEQILMERFKMECVAPRVRRRKDGKEMELDVLGYANTETNAVVVVEVKSRLTSEELKKMLNKMKSFFQFFPEHRDKKLFGILAVVDISQDLRQKVLEKGLYLAQINDETFSLHVPDDFKPRAFAA